MARVLDLRDVTFVSDELAKQLLGQTGDRFAVIDVARGHAKTQDFAPVVDHQMQLEAKEPAH